MTKGFFITISNGLLEQEHYEKMGESVWLFMWLLDKITSISEEGVGTILGGKPIKYSEINLGLTERSYRRYVKKLRESGYIKTKRTPYGLIISINRAKKVFQGDRTKMAHLSDKNGTSKRSDKNGTNKEDNTAKDNTVDNTIIQKAKAANAERLDIKLVHHFFSLKGWKYSGKPAEKKLFARNIRPAKDLLELCENDLEEAKNCLKIVSDWAGSRELSWSIETVFKKWYELDDLRPKEKKPYFDGCRIFQKSSEGRWYIIRGGEIKELGLVPRKEEIIWK